MKDLRALCRRNLVFSIDGDHVHLHGSASILTSKILCTGSFQITLPGRSGKEWSLSLELASNSCLEPRGTQFREQSSPRLVLLKSMSRLTNRCSIAMPVIAVRSHLENWPYFQTCSWIFCSLSLSLPPSLHFYLSLLFSSESSLPPSLSLSLLSCLSLLSRLSLSLSLSLSIYIYLSFPLSLSFSLSSPFLFSFLFIIIISCSWFTSSQSIWILWIFHCFSVYHPTCTC